MANFRDLLKAAKAEITEVDTAEAAEHIEAGVLVLDVHLPRMPYPAIPTLVRIIQPLP